MRGTNYITAKAAGPVVVVVVVVVLVVVVVVVAIVVSDAAGRLSGDVPGKHSRAELIVRPD